MIVKYQAFQVRVRVRPILAIYIPRHAYVFLALFQSSSPMHRIYASHQMTIIAHLYDHKPMRLSCRFIDSSHSAVYGLISLLKVFRTWKLTKRRDNSKNSSSSALPLACSWSWRNYYYHSYFAARYPLINIHIQQWHVCVRNNFLSIQSECIGTTFDWKVILQFDAFISICFPMHCTIFDVRVLTRFHTCNECYHLSKNM